MVLLYQTMYDISLLMAVRGGRLVALRQWFQDTLEFMFIVKSLVAVRFCLFNSKSLNYDS